MTDPITPDQEAATLSLLMEREVDKRVAMALIRMLDPSHSDDMRDINLQIAEVTLDSGNRERTIQMVAGLLVNILLRDGSLMHAIRGKLTEYEGSRYWK